MQNAARLSSADPLLSELFLRDISRVLGNIDDEVAYRRAVRQVLLALATCLRSGACAESQPLISRELLDSCEPPDIASLYELSLGLRPFKNGGSIIDYVDSDRRRKSGVFYTPDEFVSSLVEYVLGHLDPSHLETVKICDPACGSGAFLVAACRYICSRTGIPPKEVIAKNLFGCDCDPTALEICSHVLALEFDLERVKPNLKTANSLTADWESLFPKVLRDGGFSAVIGNPPFGGVVDGRVPAEVRQVRSERYPNVGGTADLSYYFAALAFKIAKPDARIGLVLPRTFLSAPSAELLRRGSTRTLEIIQSCPRHDAFKGAAVYVALVGFSPQPSVGQVPAQICQAAPRTLQVSASMTVDEAYRIADAVYEGRQSHGFKFVTTGLIDPEEPLWGRKTCRFLKADYEHPRIDAMRLPTARAVAARRPKILLAGLSRRLEGFLDATGEFAGSVGTYTILHQKNDLAELQGAIEVLHSPAMHDEFLSQLGPTALGGGNITVTKRFLNAMLAKSGF